MERLMVRKKQPERGKHFTRQQAARVSAVESKGEVMGTESEPITAPSEEAANETQFETPKIPEAEAVAELPGVQAINTEPEAQISEPRAIKETTTGGENMAETNEREIPQGFSETMDRAESVGQTMAQTTRGVFENVSKVYTAFFSIKGARKIAEVYIETNEKLAKEALDYGRKFVELSAGGARKFWEVAEEQGREARSGA
jgi:hypothetical protein